MATIIVWKVLASVGRTIAAPDDIQTVAFKSAPSPRIYAHLGLPLNRAYVPLGLTPTATYYQVIRNMLRDLGFPQTTYKPPFRIVHSRLGEGSLYLHARVYPPNIAVLAFRFEIDSSYSPDNSLDQLLGSRSINSDPVMKALSAYTLGIIASDDHRKPNDVAQIQGYPCFYLQPKRTRREMLPFFDVTKSSIAAVLLGINDPAAMSADLVDSPFRVNSEINKKAADECILLNKQGLVFLTAAEAVGHQASDRFEKMSDLVEAGWVFQRFLDRYAIERALQEDFADFVFMLAEAWLEHPAAIFSRSYTSRLAWEIIVGELGLSEKLRYARQNNADAVSAMADKRQALVALSSDWWKRPEFSRTFDYTLANAIKMLDKIKDPALRGSILVDLSEAQRCLDSKCFKAAVVMAGAAVEAMLLALLVQNSGPAQASKLSGMGLHDYITAVKNQKLIADVAMIDLLDNTLRDWRNLVHPGKVLRTGVVLTEEHAAIAITASRSLAKSLT